MSYEKGDTQILFAYKPHSRVRVGSNPLEMYKVELNHYLIIHNLNSAAKYYNASSMLSKL